VIIDREALLFQAGGFYGAAEQELEQALGSGSGTGAPS
jgi:hypothetical protein